MTFSWKASFFIIILGLSISTSNLVFAQSNQTANSSGPDCVYALLGNLISAKSSSCSTTGTPTVLSDAFGHVGPMNGFLLYDEKLYFNNILHRGGPCMASGCTNELTATDEEKAKACMYDNNGNFWYPLSDAQKMVLMDMQANYSVFVCPSTGKPTPPPPPTGHTTITYSGTVNVMDIGKNNTQSNATKSISDETSNPKTTNSTTVHHANETEIHFKNILNAKIDKSSPLKQEESGISAKNVQCKQDYVLVLKTGNGHPICVKPQTAEKLVKRGLVHYSK